MCCAEQKTVVIIGHFEFLSQNIFILLNDKDNRYFLKKKKKTIL